jgi:hypothetical protein
MHTSKPPKSALWFAALVLFWIGSTYFPDQTARASISNGGLLPAPTWAGVSGCIPYRDPTGLYQFQCDPTWIRDPGTGHVILSDSPGPVISLKNTGARESAYLDTYDAAGRQWVLGPGQPGVFETAWAFTALTNGVFDWTVVYLKKDGTTCLGKNNSTGGGACTTATVAIKDNTAVTGATRVLTQLGAADTANTYTDTNSGSSQVNGNLRTLPVLTANLAACGAGTAAARAAVTDATAPAIGVALTGGGAIFATVHCSSTTNSWIVDGL